MDQQREAPKAVLFGSIGTLAETSELQRRAFNAAFAEAGLDWHWDLATYARLLRRSGGRNRVARWATALGERVDVEHLHRRKTALFHDMLATTDLPLRPGVAEVFSHVAATQNVRLALVTTTSGTTVDGLLGAVHPPIGRADFDAVITIDQVTQPKPSPECYALALRHLGLAPTEAIALEDSPESAAAAVAAGIPVLAIPGRFHKSAPFPDGVTALDVLTPEALGLHLDAPAAQIATA